MGSKATYFTKLRGLSTVVWDADKDQPLAEFNREGLCCIKDSTVAKQLSDMGYLEVSAEEIKEAGLMLPNLPEKDRGPSKGYTHEKQNPQQALPSEVSGESPMEAFLRTGRKSSAKSEETPKGRAIIQ